MILSTIICVFSESFILIDFFLLIIVYIFLPIYYPVNFYRVPGREFYIFKCWIFSFSFTLALDGVKLLGRS